MKKIVFKALFPTLCIISILLGCCSFSVFAINDNIISIPVQKPNVNEWSGFVEVLAGYGRDSSAVNSYLGYVIYYEITPMYGRVGTDEYTFIPPRVGFNLAKLNGSDFVDGISFYLMSSSDSSTTSEQYLVTFSYVDSNGNTFFKTYIYTAGNISHYNISFDDITDTWSAIVGLDFHSYGVDMPSKDNSISVNFSFVYADNAYSEDIYSRLGLLNSNLVEVIGALNLTNSQISDLLGSVNDILSDTDNISKKINLINTYLSVTLDQDIKQMLQWEYYFESFDFYLSEILGQLMGPEEGFTQSPTLPPNQDEYNKIEDELLNNEDASDAQNSIDIQINENAMSYIWDLITQFIQANGKVFGLFISVLSLGIIALILNR